MTSNFTLLREAVKNKKQCTAMYDGYYREFCPHVLGWAKDESEACLIYQFGGQTSSGPVVSETKDNWRCFKIENLKNLQIRDGVWHTFGNHSQDQTCVKDIDTEVDF